MAKKTKKRGQMDDAEIMTRVNQKVKESVSWYDSRLSLERQRVINYYNTLLPKRQHLGSSPYIASDVYDSTESMKAQIVETFSANPDNLISFPPRNAQDVEAAKQATEYCNYVFFEENDGEGIMSSASHDGLTARTGVVKIYWEHRTRDEEEEFDGISYNDVQALASQDDISELDAEETFAGSGIFRGKLTRTEDISQVCVDNVPPEEFGITPRNPLIETCDCCYHRTLIEKAVLKKRYPDKADVIDELHYDDDKGLDLGPEVLARNMPVETTQALDNPIQEELEKVMLYESYVKMDIYDGRGMKLYKVVHVNETLFEMEEVNRRPFKAFCPLPIPYMFYGNNFAARCIPYQNARTVLTRAILDHAAITTNPRWGVVKGSLLNPREMLENRLGGLVNMTRPDGVKALEQAQLNPFVYQTLEMLKSNKEESTGISALSQGLNKDAISTQNSAALVDNLVNLSQTRQKMIARNFAKFLADVYLEIYTLVLENQDAEKEKIISVAGSFVPVSTKDWIERTKCTVALHLGYGERDRQVMKHQTLYKELASDPELAPMFTPQNRYNLAVDTMRIGGIQNYARYLTPPQQTKPPQPDPLKVQELQIADKKASASLMSAQATVQRNNSDAQLENTKQLIDQLNLHLKAILGARSEERKDAEVRNRIDVARRELEMLERQPISKETGVVSAH